MFTLNAWFERSTPHLELRNNYTRHAILRLSGDGLFDVLDDFGLAYEDLLENQGSAEIIKILLLATIKDYSKYNELTVYTPNNILKFPALTKSTHITREPCCAVQYDNVINMNRFLSSLLLRKV